MLWFVAKYLVPIAAGLFLLILFGQNKVIFPAGGSMWRTPGDQPFGWAYDDVMLSHDGHATHGWYMPVENPRGTILFSHGNAGCIPDRLESVAVFRALGFNVFIYDYGGYGRSSGRPSEKRCYADIRAAWRFLTEEQGVAPESIVLFGRSLGGGPTCQLATEVQPAAVILESAFLSVRKMANDMMPILPVTLVIRTKFDNADKIQRIACPILVVHSPQDDIVPYAHGRGLFELANEPKTFLEIQGNHNDGWYNSGRLYLEGLAVFLETVELDGET
ncbi:MAG: alpha/beta hydrolase [bacterium]|nr:alpha/beta hydrolase [bacterium]